MCLHQVRLLWRLTPHRLYSPPVTSCRVKTGLVASCGLHMAPVTSFRVNTGLVASCGLHMAPVMSCRFYSKAVASCMSYTSTVTSSRQSISPVTLCNLHTAPVTPCRLHTKAAASCTPHSGPGTPPGQSLAPVTSHRLLTSAAPAGRRAPDPDYEIIFRFPYIRQLRMLCRLKLYQTGVTVTAVPAAALLYGPEAAAKVGAVGLLAVLMLYVMGEFFRRFVGLIYLHRDRSRLKVAHLTFWGGRRDLVLPVSDVKPLSELDDSPEDVYFALRRYSCPDKLYVSLRYGGVENAEKLESVFGPLRLR